MKSLVIYYSHSGNTAHIAYKLLAALNEKGEAKIFQLKYTGRKKGFLSQLLYRFLPVRVSLSDAPLDVKDYDVICIGVPVWGGRPAPPVSAYIRGCRNTDGKKIICFQIYGIEGSARRCINYIKRILDKKGHSSLITMDIRWRKVRDEEFVNKVVQETVHKLSLLL